MKIKVNIKHRIKAIFELGFFLTGGEYCQAFDTWLRRSIEDSLPFYNIQESTAHINGMKLWIGNHPYHSFHLLTKDNQLNAMRASRTTIILAKEWLDYCKFEKQIDDAAAAAAEENII